MLDKFFDDKGFKIEEDRLEVLMEAAERGELPGEPGPHFDGLPPDWYLKKLASGVVTDEETTRAQLETARLRISQLERAVIGLQLARVS